MVWVPNIMNQNHSNPNPNPNTTINNNTSTSTTTPPKTNNTHNKKKGNKSRLKQVKYFDEETDAFGYMEYDEAAMLALMTEEEIADYKKHTVGDEMSDNKASAARAAMAAVDDNLDMDEIEAVFYDALDDKNTTNPSLSETSPNSNNGQGFSAADFNSRSSPSVVAWLKQLKASEGTPIRGGKFWKAISGAIDIDDSGLVVLCPKDGIDNVFIDQSTYLAVVGNGEYLAPKRNKNSSQIKTKNHYESVQTESEVNFQIFAKLIKGRGNDVVSVVQVHVPGGASTCTDAVHLCQGKFADGIRGDPAANPLDRRAPRRLLHCQSITASSLIHEDAVDNASSPVPDDIAIMSDRRNLHGFTNGSFLGRSKSLKRSQGTTIYREINGAADGFPGWIVDRYDKWLFVQHDKSTNEIGGPLPSLHDGNTAGVYHFQTEPDRSVTSSKNIKPKLLEGQSVPSDYLKVRENGIIYYAKLDTDLSTGIFLDQRPQRAWLAANCNESTRVLNCFAHCGAFSVAAATAGASTVSLDLDKKWLDRIEMQMEDNGIKNFSEKHDTIYGDCFDWLARLVKRNEKYDIVILDPPSTSVGGKKKRRWSAKKDYDELVSLAAPLIKSGGLLWTTTNSASISPERFARSCKKGLDTAGLSGAKLERVAPMPSDFPCVGSAPVKNLIWRVP
mmetsp:Transcript_3951/g.5384  ORF Transcript_3951/g.5384 Transcript_3951/m.5384 type:complete len:672 (-) Transcript_3951:106-2121(-)